MSKLTLTKRPTPRQLTLPWPELKPPRPQWPSDGPILPPQQVWPSLTPTLQMQVRTTILRLIQEVLHEPA